MSNPIIIQDLPVYIDPVTFKVSSIDESFLLSLFDELDNPPIKADIQIKTYSDGTPYAYAQIQFETIEQATKAISEVNYTKLDGEPIRLKVWNSQERNNYLENKGKILIKNLSQDIDIIDFDYTMSDFGEVIDCEIPTRDGQSFSYGIIQYRDPQDAKKAIKELKGKSFGGQKVEAIEMEEKKSKKATELNKNYQQLTIFSGLNDYNQLYYMSTEKNSEDDFIISPPINYPLRAVALSYSIYYQHSVSIYQNTKAFGIGNNSKFRVNYTKQSKIEYKSEILIRFSKKRISESFQSAVCGSEYTLYLCNQDAETNRPFLAINGLELNGGKAIAFDLGSEVPVSLYGGDVTSAAIDTNGSVLIVVKDSLFKAILPEEKKAVLLACLNQKVVALSSDGYLYELSIESLQSADDNESIEFELIPELSKIRFNYVSGSSMHCLAVSKSGSVYVCGDNSCGQCGANSDKKYFDKYVKLKKFTNSKITAAFAGYDHSLFMDENGAVYACGNNSSGQLLTNIEPSDEPILRPVKTVIQSGATFCIAGKELSVAFLYSKPPPNTPNMKIEGQNKNKDDRQAELSENEEDDNDILTENKNTFEEEEEEVSDSDDGNKNVLSEDDEDENRSSTKNDSNKNKKNKQKIKNDVDDDFAIIDNDDNDNINRMNRKRKDDTNENKKNIKNDASKNKNKKSIKNDVDDDFAIIDNDDNDNSNRKNRKRKDDKFAQKSVKQSNGGNIIVDDARAGIKQILNCLLKENQLINQLIEENKKTNDAVSLLCSRLDQLMRQNQKQSNKGNRLDEKTAKTKQAPATSTRLNRKTKNINYKDDEDDDNDEENEEEEYNEDDDDDEHDEANINEDDDDNDDEEEDDDDNDSKGEYSFSDGDENDDDDDDDAVDENEEEEEFDDKSSRQKGAANKNAKPNKSSNEDSDLIETISFTDGQYSLDNLSQKWKFGTTKRVEFFPDQFTPVTVVNSSDTVQVKKSLEGLIDGHAIACNFVQATYSLPEMKNPIVAFEFCSKKGVVIILNSKDTLKKIQSKGIPHIKKFLKSNFFYGLKIQSFQKKFRQIFQRGFDIEDIEITRLQPKKLAANFDYLVEGVHGAPAANFNDQKKLNWNAWPISQKVAVCAAFRVYGLRLIWRYFVRTFKEPEFISLGKKVPQPLNSQPKAKSTNNNKNNKNKNKNKQ